MIGLRVGPFEITEAAKVPEPGDWYRAKRTGMTRRKPHEVLVQVLHSDATGGERGQLQLRYDNLRGVEDARVPEAVAIYEGLGAIAISGVYGGGLDRIIDARRTNTVVMTPATLLDILLEVAETLQHAHHRGRCHGHLSADNIWISPEGQVWIFGFAGGSEQEASELWQPPERARGEQSTEATDQWSLAALAAALITGRVPWRNVDQAQQGDPESIVEPVERQWPALARLLRKMLDNRPANRYPTMHQVRQQLLALSRKAGGTSDRRFLGQWLADRASDSDAPLLFTAEAPHADTPAPAARTAPVARSAPAPETATTPEPVADAAALPESPLPASEEQTLDAFEEFQPAPAAFAQADPPSHASDPEIPEARTLSADNAPAIPKRAHTPLPAEQLPVVRPEIPGEVPEAAERHSEETAETEQMHEDGPGEAWDLNAPPSVVEPDESPTATVLPAPSSPPAFVEPVESAPDDAPAEVRAKDHVSAEDDESAEAEMPDEADMPERSMTPDRSPEVATDEPQPQDPPEGIADQGTPVTAPVAQIPGALKPPEPESERIVFPEDLLIGADVDNDDEEATVLFNQEMLEADLAAAGFVLIDGHVMPAEVEVSPTDAGPTPTMVPSTDSRDASEELRADGQPLTAGDPSSAGWLPQNGPVTGTSGPQVGQANVTMGHEPTLPSGEDGPPVAPLPPREISIEQKAAIGAVGVMLLLFVIWAVKTGLS